MPKPIAAYFDADARRDTNALVALFADNAEVVDEGTTWRGLDKIRSWRNGPAARFEYQTEVVKVERVNDSEYSLEVRLEGNFPGGVADLTCHFTLSGDSISALRIR